MGATYRLISTVRNGNVPFQGDAAHGAMGRTYQVTMTPPATSSVTIDLTADVDGVTRGMSFVPEVVLFMPMSDSCYNGGLHASEITNESVTIEIPGLDEAATFRVFIGRLILPRS